MRHYSQTACAKALRRMHERRMAAGVCVTCEEPHQTGKQQCQGCLDRKAQRWRELYSTAARRAALFLVLSFLSACDGCGPSGHDYLGCALACGRAGVAQVTFAKCICAGVHDGGAP